MNKMISITDWCIFVFHTFTKRGFVLKGLFLASKIVFIGKSAANNSNKRMLIIDNRQPKALSLSRKPSWSSVSEQRIITTSRNRQKLDSSRWTKIYCWKLFHSA